MDEPERCPWCGEDCDDPRVGRGDQLDVTRYNLWLEEHVTACEPFIKESLESER